MKSLLVRCCFNPLDVNIEWGQDTTLVLTGPILDIWGMGAFFRAHFLKKKKHCFLVPPKQMSFLTISNDNNSGH